MATDTRNVAEDQKLDENLLAGMFILSSPWLNR